MRILKARGYEFTVNQRNSKLSDVYLKGGMTALLRMLSETRPERFISRDLSMLWEDRESKGMRFQRARIMSIKDQGVQPISGLQTSTGTFIANGMLCHNTFVEAMKHLIRAYNEQPNLVGAGSVTRLDRRAYADRRRASLQHEQAEAKH